MPDKTTNARKHKYRAFLYIYQSGRCAYCLKQMRLSFNHEHANGNLATLDHIKPLSKNGKTTWSNLVLCCSSCNHSKGSKIIKPTLAPLERIDEDGKIYRGFDNRIFYSVDMKAIAQRLYEAPENYSTQTDLQFPIDLVQSMVSQPTLKKR